MKCDIATLRAHFPKDFQPWTSQGESILNKHGCDLITVPSKNGVMEYLIGNKINSTVFEAVGYIQAYVDYDEEKENWNTSFGKAHAFKKRKVVVAGINGTGAVLPVMDVNRVFKSMKDLVNGD